ncbi:ComEA family DNA-binding protein [Alloscardovia criceti]|uniref:ComEA family DNA-binding protein n=1 Tax=Alloscardovia criceti TaxID=356828 RepID=UPI00036FEBFE|nr:helix-hairpin-helix domain-containing protein [Alloscardovia criceti]
MTKQSAARHARETVVDKRERRTAESILPRMLGSPAHSALVILVLVLALSTSLTLLVIQSTELASLASAQSENASTQPVESSLSGVTSSAQGTQSQAPTEMQTHTDPSTEPAPTLEQSTQSTQNTQDIPSEQSQQAQGININTATAEELQNIPGVGPVMAQKILDYRSTHGPFHSVDDLMEVSGIGAKTLEKMRAHVRAQ